MGLFGFSRIESIALEDRFRRESLQQDSRQMQIVVLVGLLTVAAFSATDVISAATIGVTHACRILVAVTMAIAVVVFRRTQSVMVFDRTTTLALWVFIAHNILISLYRPPDFTQGVVLNVLTVLSIYTAMPAPLRIQTPPAVFLSLADSTIWILYRQSVWEPFATISVLAAYLLANILGTFVSYRLHASRRRAFIHLCNEQEAGRRLQRALDELKVLRGMIPICCMCKRIRDDKGYFEALEDYLRRHSEADFTHTLCPDCLKKHYPDFSRAVLGEQSPEQQS
jgi:hypothetical protein